MEAGLKCGDGVRGGVAHQVSIVRTSQVLFLLFAMAEVG